MEDKAKELKMLRKKARHWKQLANALDKILVAYRLQRSPPLGALDHAAAARKKLRDMGETSV